MLRILVSAIALMSVSSAALAQSNQGAPPDANRAKAKDAAIGINQNGTTANPQQQLTDNLQQAGFTDIKIIAQSFFVQAKDQSGNNVTIFLQPHSMTVISENETGDRKTNASGSTFITVQATDDLSTRIIGLNVVNSNNQSIGAITDIAFGTTGVQAFVVGVGGFIGMDENHVAVRPSEIMLSYDSAANKWRAATNITIEQLKAAPDAFSFSPQTGAGSLFMSISSKNDLSSQVIGLNVVNGSDQNIGTIKDVAFNKAGGVSAYIVGVGGLLGLGEHYVAVRPSAMTLTYNGSEKNWHASLDTNADQIKLAPEYLYSGNGK